MNEQCAGGCAANGNIANLTYRSMNWAVGWAGTFTWRASLSYVTGAHNMKFGYNGGHLVDNFENFTNSQNLLYRVNNGVPNRITQTMLPLQDAAERRLHGVLRAGAVDAGTDDAARRAAIRACVGILPAADDRAARTFCRRRSRSRGRSACADTTT